MNDRSYSLDDFACADPREFVDAAYRDILGRTPTAAERDTMVEMLVTGSTRTFALGMLRYGREGRARGAAVAGLRSRYLAQRLFRIPLLGRVLEWTGIFLRLPRTLRYFRGAVETSAVHYSLLQQQLDALQNSVQGHAIDLQTLAVDLQTLAASSQSARTRLDAIHPPPLAETLMVLGKPLAALAKARGGIAPDVSIGGLSSHTRYALFETVFYDSRAVAAKQRIYLDYLDQELARQAPILDLGCGRGEFLQLLREAGIDAVGVDLNAEVVNRLQANGFAVIEQDLLAFLESDSRMFSGAVALQVAEHLTAAQIERMLELVARRLLPGAPLIVETPNPLSPFALGVFHTDATHVDPIPPERMRYSIETAGFEDAKTLFQAKIPSDQFAGPDPRAYYADYAIIARRSTR